MVLAAMLQGGWRRYRLLFAYVMISSLATVVQASLLEYFGAASKQFARGYWASDLLGTVVLLLAIIHLIRRAMEGHARREHVYWGLLLGMMAIGAASVLFVRVHPRGFSWGRWMTEVSRDYYFGATLLNALLWFTLTGRQNRDRQLYLVASGLGLMLSGAAVAHAVRLTGRLVGVANFFLIATYLASLYVWRCAFKKVAVPAAAEAPQPHTAQL